MSFAQARLSSFPTQSLRGTAPIIAPVVAAPDTPGVIPYVIAAVGIYFLFHQTAKQMTPPSPRRRFAR